MKGIFKQALSVTLLLSVVTSSVFASEPVVAPKAATWGTSFSNAWTNARNSVTNSNAWKSGKVALSSASTKAQDFVLVNGPKLVESAKANKAATAGIAAGTLLGTGLAVYGLKKAYRYFRPAIVKPTFLAETAKEVTMADFYKPATIFYAAPTKVNTAREFSLADITPVVPVVELAAASSSASSSVAPKRTLQESIDAAYAAQVERDMAIETYRITAERMKSDAAMARALQDSFDAAPVVRPAAQVSASSVAPRANRAGIQAMNAALRRA